MTATLDDMIDALPPDRKNRIKERVKRLIEEDMCDNRILKCPCGAKTATSIPKTHALNIKYTEEETQWLAVFSGDGGTIWLCSNCGHQARCLATRLVELVGGTTDISIMRLSDQWRKNYGTV